MKNVEKNRCFLILVAGMTIFSVVWFSCTDDFTKYNMDKNEIMELGQSQYAGAFSRILKTSLDWYDCEMHDISNAVTLHSSGYTVTGFPLLDRFALRAGWTQSAFLDQSNAIFYANAIMDKAQESGDMNVYNMIKIYRSFSFLLLTDVWGPIPYKELGNGKLTVRYESQRDVYYQLFEDLTAAVAALTEELDKNPALNVFGAGDVIFGGSVSQWVKFANVIRLRMALRISNVEPEKAKLEGEAAIATNLLLKYAGTDDMSLPTDPKFNMKNDNGYNRMNGYGEVIMSNNMESFLIGFKDPRVKEFFSPTTEEGWAVADFPEFAYRIGKYCGMASGTPHAKKDPVYLSHSKMGPRFHPDRMYITPTPVFNAAETWFLLAEAAWREWSGAGDMKTNYETGIRESMKQWGITDQTEIDSYLDGESKPSATEYCRAEIEGEQTKFVTTIEQPLSTICVKFSSDKQEQYEQIITQKWLAMYPNSTEAWAEYRRTRLPKLYPKKSSVNPNVDPAKGQILTRLPFIEDEVASNREEIAKAIQLLGGPDLETTPLWWDIHPNGK